MLDDAEKKPEKEQLAVSVREKGHFKELGTTALRYIVGLTATVGIPYFAYKVGTDFPPFSEPDNTAETAANYASATTATATGVAGGVIAFLYTLAGAK